MAQWAALTSCGLGVHLFEGTFADPSEVSCVPTTMPSHAVRIGVQVVALNANGEELCRIPGVTSERVHLPLPSDYQGMFAVRAYSEEYDLPSASAVAVVGDSLALFKSAIEMAREAAARIKPVEGQCEDPAATLMYSADLLEGKVHSSLITAESQIAALSSISCICAALRTGQWQIGQFAGLRQWAYLSKIDGSVQPYVVVVTDYLRYGRQYWLQMEDLVPGLTGMMKARLEEGAVAITTSGVRAFSLDTRHPSLAGRPSAMVKIDDSVLEIVPGRDRVIFAKVDGRWEETTVDLPQTVVRRLGGGLADLLMDPVVFVYGTSDPARTGVLRRAAERSADWTPTSLIPVGSKIGRFRVIADVEVSEEDLKGKNLLLFGDPNENSVLAGLVDGLPVAFDETGDFEFAGERFRSAGISMVFPNPQAPDRLLGVVTLPFDESVVDYYFATANVAYRTFGVYESAVDCMITPDVTVYKSLFVQPRSWYFDRLWQHPTELKQGFP